MVSVKQSVPKKVKPKKLKTSIKPEKVKKTKVPKVLAAKTLPTKESKIKEVQSKVENVVIKKKVKYVMPSKAINESLVDLSLNALQKLTIETRNKKTIFDDETPIFVAINCIKIQSARGNIKFVLPHSTVASTREICLITPDLKKGRKIDHEPTIDHWEEELRNAGVTSVKTVLPMRQLRVEYDQYELKRRLLTQHDFIMVDTRVLNHVSHILGKMFFKKHNMLIPVRLNEKGNIKKDIEVGLCTSMLRLSEGVTSTITVGHTGMPQEHVKENILSLVKQLREKYPGGEANIRSIFIKLPLSLALPLYITLRPSSTTTAPKMKQKKPKHFTDVEDELSTIPGRTVRVAPDGTVHLSKRTLPDESDVEEIENSDKDEVQEQLSGKEEE